MKSSTATTPRPNVIALLRTPRWIGFTALVLGAIVGFGLLSQWQFGRAEERRDQRSAMETATSETVRSLEEAMDAAPFTSVELIGSFSPETVLVRNRPLGGGNGYWVLSPWQEEASGDRVWVVRGWLAATSGATETVTAPAPTEEIRVLTGVTRSFEHADARPSDLPAGQVQAVSLTQLGEPSTPLWIQSTADSTLTPVPLPTIDEGRNISYAWQWLLFASIALSGWFIFLRREASLVAADTQSDHDAVTP